MTSQEYATVCLISSLPHSCAVMHNFPLLTESELFKFLHCLLSCAFDDDFFCIEAYWNVMFSRLHTKKAKSMEHEARREWSLKYVSRHALTGEACLVKVMASADAGLGVLALMLTVKWKRKNRRHSHKYWIYSGVELSC